MSDLRENLNISVVRLDEINEFLSDPNNELVNQIIEIIERSSPLRVTLV